MKKIKDLKLKKNSVKNGIIKLYYEIKQEEKNDNEIKILRNHNFNNIK